MREKGGGAVGVALEARLMMPERSAIVVSLPLEVITAVLFHVEKDTAPETHPARWGPSRTKSGQKRRSPIGDGATTALAAARDRSGSKRGTRAEVQFARREDATRVRELLLNLADRERTTEKTSTIFRDAAAAVDAALRAGRS